MGYTNTRQSICIISAHRFQSELLVRFLQKELELPCCSKSPLDLNLTTPLPPSGMVDPEEKNPSLVLWDFDDEDTEPSWDESILHIESRWETSYIAVLNVKNDHKFAEKAIRSGIRGIFFRETGAELLIRGIKAILGGELWYPRELLANYLQAISVQPDKHPANVRPLVNEQLTHRENAILQKIASGFSVTQIAGEFSISPHTVKTHIRNIYKKLGVNNRFEAIRKVFWTN